MPKMIQIRHVPAQLHRTLKARAAMAGKSLSEYLLGELERSAEHLTPDELRERLAALDAVSPRESSAAAVRAVRADRARR